MQTKLFVNYVTPCTLESAATITACLLATVSVCVYVSESASCFALPAPARSRVGDLHCHDGIDFDLCSQPVKKEIQEHHKDPIR